MGGSMERNRVDLTMDCLARDREVEMAWKVCACVCVCAGERTAGRTPSGSDLPAQQALAVVCKVLRNVASAAIRADPRAHG